MSKLPILDTRVPAGALDADVVAVFQDHAEKKKRPLPPVGPYGALVEKLRKGESFSAGQGSAEFIRFGGKAPAESCLLVGMGAPEELTEEKARAAGGHAWTRLKSAKCKSVTIQVDSFFGVKGIKSELSHLSIARAFAEGLVLGAYEFNRHKSSARSEKPAAGVAGPAKLIFVTQEKGLRQQLENEFDRILAAVEAMNVTRDWSNEPSNFGTPEFYATEARKFARQYGLKCTVLTERDAAREKMGLYLGVGQGSDREGRIVVLEYTPKGAKKGAKTVALVGKGITFDTGGISIKPAPRMEEMKHDMTGAATVMGAILLAARWKVPNRVVAIMAFTENMPDGHAINPGDVITARNGKTVEVINTDAEGRLILADALDYAHDFAPDAIIDVATLTGAVGVALGKYCCAVLGNDDLLVDAIRRAGESHGEKLWQLPLWDEYFDDMKSEVADMKNVGPDSYGGTIRGGIFLKQFVKKGVQWAHLDIAVTCYNLGHVPYFPKKGASGSFVRTLARFVAEY